MDVTAAFKGLEPYKLTGVMVTEQVTGQDPTTDMVVDCKGLKCVGKMIIELLLMQEDLIQQFEENCHLLCQIRHPNIVQFLGVYFQEGVLAPILVMEFLPTNLTSCIDQHGLLPNEISYSILYDVALALCYLHSHTPPIIHGNLSSNNVLLDSNMTAKLSDLGTLSLTPLQITHMTQTPKTMVYIPPEVMTAEPKYDTSVDEFSYGILMIHIFSGKWPDVQSESTTDDMTPFTEADRREMFLKAVGNDHPLVELILRCININSQERPHANEIMQQLSKMVSKFPASYANRLDLLRQIEMDQSLQKSIAGLQEDMNQTEQQFFAQMKDIERLKIENKQLKAKVMKNSDLIGNAIQALQQAQEQRRTYLKDFKMDTPKTHDHGTKTPRTSPTDENEGIKQVSRIHSYYLKC